MALNHLSTLKGCMNAYCGTVIPPYSVPQLIQLNPEPFYHQ